MGALFLLFPEQKRALPYVLIGMVSLLAPAVGAGTGGYVTSALSWPWLFLINLVPGLLVSALVWTFVDIDKAQTSLLARLDIAGLLGLAAGLGGLQYVLEEGARHDWFEDQNILRVSVISAAGLLLFAVRTRVAAEPIIQLGCLRNRNFAVGCASSFVVGVMLYGAVYIIPTFLGFVRGYNSLQIGEITMLSGITMFLSAPLAGRLQARVDVRWMMAYGLVMVATGNWLDAALTSESGFAAFLLPQLVRGHGFTFCLVPVTQIALGTLPPDLVKSGSGLFNLMRNLGGAFGIAGIQTLLRHFRAVNDQALMAQLTSSRVPVRDAIQTLAQQVPGDRIDAQVSSAAFALMARLLHREAAVLAFNNTFLVLAGVVIAAVALLPLARKPDAATLIQTRGD